MKMRQVLDDKQVQYNEHVEYIPADSMSINVCDKS